MYIIGSGERRRRTYKISNIQSFESDSDPARIHPGLSTLSAYQTRKVLVGAPPAVFENEPFMEGVLL
jgi:hypothetical protein